MIHQFQCQTCKGVYTDIGTDGMIYTHVCGPQNTEQPGPTVDRPDKRDENIDTNRSGVLLGIVSEGLGVVCLSDETLTEPPWITRLKASIPAEESEGA